MAGRIGPIDHALAVALDGEGEHTRRMAEGVDGADARHHLVTRFDHGGAVGERHNDLDVKLAIELTRFTHVLALVPEIKFGCAEALARLGKPRLSGLAQTADMIGM